MISFSKLGQSGRLGNQLFQVSAAIAAGERFGEPVKFPQWEYGRFFAGEFDQTLNIDEIENIYEEPNFRYSPIPHKPNTDLFGAFQSERYFADHADLIRRKLAFKPGLVP